MEKCHLKSLTLNAKCQNRSLIQNAKCQNKSKTQDAKYKKQICNIWCQISSQIYNPELPMVIKNLLSTMPKVIIAFNPQTQISLQIFYSEHQILPQIFIPTH